MVQASKNYIRQIYNISKIKANHKKQQKLKIYLEVLTVSYSPRPPCPRWMGERPEVGYNKASILRGLVKRGCFFQVCVCVCVCVWGGGRGELVLWIFPELFLSKNSTCSTLVCVKSEYSLKYGVVSNVTSIYDFLCQIRKHFNFLV